MKKYFAFKFENWPWTKTGEPHPTNGKYSIAGELAVFSLEVTRDEWVSEILATGQPAVPVSAKEARELHAGMTMKQYNKMVESILNRNI